MKITREALKTIVKETMIEESEYQEFFKKALEKAGGSIPKMSEEEKKAFFNKIEKTWKGKGEKNEISETELEEAQSPAQKAAFAKMLAKKDGKDESTDDEKEEVKESVVNEEFKGNGNDFKYKFTMNLESHLQRTDKKHEIGKRDAYTSIKKITAKKDKRYEVRLSNHLSDKTFLEKVGKGIGAKLVDFKKGSTNIALYESVVKEAIIKEGFAVWEMSFADMNLNGVALSSKKKYKVKARNTVEAIKKAASMAGLKGQDWVATQTNYLKKIG